MLLFILTVLLPSVLCLGEIRLENLCKEIGGSNYHLFIMSAQKPCTSLHVCNTSDLLYKLKFTFWIDHSFLRAPLVIFDSVRLY